MSSQFVGREQELRHFKQLLKKRDGAVWAVTGAGGQGKSSLLRRCEELCESQQNVRTIWIAVDRFDSSLEYWEFASDFLLDLEISGCAELKTLQDKAAGVHRSIVQRMMTDFQTETQKVAKEVLTKKFPELTPCATF